MLAGRGGEATLLDATAGRGLCVKRTGQERRQTESSGYGRGGRGRCTGDRESPAIQAAVVARVSRRMLPAEGEVRARQGEDVSRTRLVWESKRKIIRKMKASVWTR